MLFKKQIKKILVISMPLSMIFCNSAFATPIDLANSGFSVTTDTLDKVNGTDCLKNEENEWLNGEITECVEVTVKKASEFEITIPKEIILDGSNGEANYFVNAKGDIAGDQVLVVIPDVIEDENNTDNSFLMTSPNKKSIEAVVTQDDTEYTYREMLGNGTDYPGTVRAPLTAGEWEGKFAFNISFKGSKLPPVGTPIEEMSWKQIADISEAGLAKDYFAVGDEKKMMVGGDEYTAQIIGFDHDYIMDEENPDIFLTKDEDGNILNDKAGITFQFKEVMTTDTINGYNGSKWETSLIRDYMNTTLFEKLEEDLQREIKYSFKISDIGDKTSGEEVITRDKLFSLSVSEVGFDPDPDSVPKMKYPYAGSYGEKYEFFTNNRLLVKYNKQGNVEHWMLRSATSGTGNYFIWPASDDEGYYCYDWTAASNSDKQTYLIAPAFCI